MILRPYQTTVEANIFDAWHKGHQNVLCFLPCGGGKTVVNASVVRKCNVPTAVVAHRRELVHQLSMAVAAVGIRHGIIGSKQTIKHIIDGQHHEFGRSYYDPESPTKVGSIGTFISRQKANERWASHVRLWCQDEAHHVLIENQWGKGRALFPNAFGLGLTATPRRTDGKGLGRSGKVLNGCGVFDHMVEGPSMRDLIDMGMLTDYRLIAPPTDLDVSDVLVSSSTGEYQKDGVRKAIKRSHITGDVVTNYAKYAAGKLAVCFADSIENGTTIARRFNDAGIRAEIITGDTDPFLRYSLLQRFKRREIKVIVNVDLFGEGTDIPAIECCIMARPTMSLSLYIQQFGRALRLLKDKVHGIIIDHVENWKRHGLPDATRVWSLDGREKGSRSKFDPDVIPLTDCPKCFEPYEAVKSFCPHCGHKPIPDPRGGLETVKGDLIELSPAMLARMRAKADYIDRAPSEVQAKLLRDGASMAVAGGAAANHRKRQEVQGQLRGAIALWAGIQRHNGRPDSESYRLFYLRYGVDVLSAQGLDSQDARKLTEKVQNDISG